MRSLPLLKGIFCDGGKKKKCAKWAWIKPAPPAGRTLLTPLTNSRMYVLVHTCVDVCPTAARVGTSFFFQPSKRHIRTYCTEYIHSLD